MKLGIVLTAVGLAGTVLFLAGAADFSNAELYGNNPWILAAGGAFFIVFLIGMYHVRKEIRLRRKRMETHGDGNEEHRPP